MPKIRIFTALNSFFSNVSFNSPENIRKSKPLRYFQVYQPGLFQLTEAATGSVLLKKVFLNSSQGYRKTPVLEPLF